MLIHSRTIDLMDWLLPKVERFPRIYRHNLTQRIINVMLDFHENLVLAQSYQGRPRRKQLQYCDAKLTQLRAYLRLIYSWRWLNEGQYQHVSRIVAEIGRLLGGWLKQSERGGKSTPALR